MEQRPLRLGDLVDDYCPRERRVTNHAIVAIVGDGIRQTRCMTCDTEHVFKAGRLPRRRAKEDEADLGEPNGQPVTVSDVDSSAEAYATAPAGAERGQGAPAHRQAQGVPSESRDASDGVGESAGAEPLGSESDSNRPEPLWPANRTLIRAQLPRVEGEQPPPRPIPEFTIYQRHNSRGAGGFRRGGGGGMNGGGGGGWSGRGGQEPNGNRAGGNGGHDRRPGGGGPPGHSNGGGAGFGSGQGQGQGRRRHGKRRPPRP